MKKSSLVASLAAAALLLAGSAVHAQGDTVILDVVANSPTHSTLTAAVLAADPSIGSLLADPTQSLTLFAPDDTAFAALDADSLNLLTSPPWQQHLSCVLTGHVYAGGAVPSTDITGPLTVDSLTPGYALNLNGPSPVTVNDIPVAGPDIGASNGIIHSLSAYVLLPDCVLVDLGTVLSADPRFSTLVSLVEAAGLTDVLDVLATPATAEGLTILAPTDEAFAAVDPAVLDFLSANPDALLQVLQYHVIPQNYDGSTPGSLETFLGETVEATLNGDMLMINDATVTRANVLANNGIIHEIDAVLIPSTLQLPPTAGPPTTIEPPPVAIPAPAPVPVPPPPPRKPIPGHRPKYPTKGKGKGKGKGGLYYYRGKGKGRGRYHPRGGVFRRPMRNYYYRGYGMKGSYYRKGGGGGYYRYGKGGGGTRAYYNRGGRWGRGGGARGYYRRTPRYHGGW